MKRRLSIYRSKSVEINMSPLIDMVFILLIFFIVATSFISEVGLTSRHQDTADPLHKLQEPLILEITASGQVLKKGRSLGVAGVGGAVRSASSSLAKPVIIKVERGARAGLAVQVMDAALGAGAKAVKMSSHD